MCEICRSTPCSFRCPNYKSHGKIFCSSCGESITEGEEYIDNGSEYRHYECFYGLRELLCWLGYEIKTMEDT